MFLWIPYQTRCHIGIRIFGCFFFCVCVLLSQLWWRWYLLPLLMIMKSLLQDWSFLSRNTFFSRYNRENARANLLSFGRTYAKKNKNSDWKTGRQWWRFGVVCFIELNASCISTVRDKHWFDKRMQIVKKFLD